MRGRSITVQWFEGVDADGTLIRRARVEIEERLPAPHVAAERAAAIEVAPMRPTVRKALRLVASSRRAA